MLNHANFTWSCRVRQTAQNVSWRCLSVLVNLGFTHFQSLFVKLFKAICLSDTLGLCLSLEVEEGRNIVRVAIVDVPEVMNKILVHFLNVFQLLLGVILQIFIGATRPRLVDLGRAGAHRNDVLDSLLN